MADARRTSDSPAPEASDRALEAALAAAFGPDPTPPPAVPPGPAAPHGWVNLRSGFRLRDLDTEVMPLVRPQSNGVPAARDAGGRYHLVGEIARGGMGVVLQGRDLCLGRDLAVKVLLEG